MDNQANNTAQQQSNVQPAAQQVPANAQQQPATNTDPSNDQKGAKNKNLKASSTMQSKRKRFKYKAQTDKGKIITGFLDAYNQTEVTSYLKNEGYKILKIEEVNAILNMEIGGGRLSYAELAFLLTQLSHHENNANP